MSASASVYTHHPSYSSLSRLAVFAQTGIRGGSGSPNRCKSIGLAEAQRLKLGPVRAQLDR